MTPFVCSFRKLATLVLATLAFATLALGTGCVQSRPQTAKLDSGHRFTLVVPTLLRDPKDDTQDLVIDAFDSLNQALGGDTLEIRTESAPMACWLHERAIPYAKCHREALARLEPSGEDTLLWGFALDAKAQVFTLFASTRGAPEPEQLRPTGANGMLTRRDFLDLFRGIVFARISSKGEGSFKTRSLRDRLAKLASAVPATPRARLWAADLALFSADISQMLDTQHPAPAELSEAHKGYARALQLYSKQDQSGPWLTAELGLASTELRLGNKQKNTALLLQAAAHFADVQASSTDRPTQAIAEEGRSRALLSVGELTQDASQILQALAGFERVLSSHQEASQPSSQKLRVLVCQTAVSALRLSAKVGPQAREACERAYKSHRPLDTDCSTEPAALMNAYLGELSFRDASSRGDLGLLKQAPARLRCARTFPQFSPIRRQTITLNLARSLQELGVKQENASELREAAALFRGLLLAREPPNRREHHEALGLILAFLGRIEPTALTLNEALHELDLALPSGEQAPTEVRLAHVRVTLALAALSSDSRLRAGGEAELQALSAELIFGVQPKLWLEVSILRSFLAWQSKESTASELKAAIDLSNLSEQRAGALFPQQARAAQLLSALLGLRYASLFKDKQALCPKLAEGHTLLASLAEPSVSLWPNPRPSDLAQTLKGLESEPKLARICKNSALTRALNPRPDTKAR